MNPQIIIGIIILLVALYMRSKYTDNSTQSSLPVVVVGGGLAGLSAAIEASRSGSSVIILESEKRIGGNSAKATSGINGAPTNHQSALGIKDSVNLFLTDSIKSGDGISDDILVKKLVEESSEAIRFLEEFGLNLSTVNPLGGHSRPRTHRSPPPKEGRASNIGSEIINKLLAHISNDPKIEIKLESKFINLELNEKKEVIGVIYQNTNVQPITTHTLKTKAVIFCSGGYAFDQDGYLREYFGDLSNLPTTSGSFADGTILRVLTKSVDAQLVHMDKIQVHPTAFVSPSDPLNRSKLLAAEALRGVGGILLNSEGKRFTNELGRRDHTSHAIYKNAQKQQFQDSKLIQYRVYMILNDYSMDAFGRVPLSFYMSKGFFTQYNNAKEFSEKADISYDNILKTFNDYNQHVGTDSAIDSFGKIVFPTAFDHTKPLYVAQVTPAIHYTMGGLKITTETQIVDSKGKPIPKLYAAGEATGGVHGENRLGGNSLLECVVFGRTAGQVSGKL